MEKILSLIKSGIPTITVNNRLARLLKIAYNDRMISSGKKGWHSPIIMPFSDWIRSIFEESWPDKPILSKVRSNSLWESIILQDTFIKGSNMLNLRGIVKSASDAYTIIKSYRLPFPEEDIYLSVEGAALKRWIIQYEKELKSCGFIDSAELTDTVTRFIKEGNIDIPNDITVAGFNELRPQTKSLLDAINKDERKIYFWPQNPKNLMQEIDVKEFKERTRVRIYQDRTEEVMQTARRIRKIYQPGIRIGVVVPELEKYRTLLEREFAAELDPQSILPWKRREPVFNISLGKSLYEEPVICSAIKLLSFIIKELDIDDIGFILRNPYISGGSNEYIERERLHYFLRYYNYQKISLSETLKVLSESKLNLPMLRKQLAVLEAAATLANVSRSPIAWVEKFTDLLKKLGWGVVSLSSMEHQAIEAWNKTLAAFTSLDNFIGKINGAKAVSKLTQIVRETVHQPETPDSPIQILGLLETAGFQFNHLFILGADEDSLPSTPSPNPLLSVELQKRFNTPHSSPERELEFARTLVAGLLKSSKNIDISYPKMIDDRETRLSPLFSHFKEKDSYLIRKSYRFTDLVHLKGMVEEIPEKYRIPVSADERKAIRGGTKIIKDYALCPFMAFANHRLKIKPYPRPMLGIQPVERGNITHIALRIFWSRVKTGDNLKNLLKKDELKEIIFDVAGEALNHNVIKRPLSDNYLAIEHERLCSVLSRWLILESERLSFQVIEMEKKIEISVSGLDITVKIDRIDRLEDGKLIIIDYKTGECSRSDWLSSRPREPQLLIYSMTGDYDVVSFAKLKAGENGFIGISKTDEILPGLKGFEHDKFKDEYENWNNMISSWREVVENLAADFMKGDISVDPKDFGVRGKSACEYCELASFCRINEWDG